MISKNSLQETTKKSRFSALLPKDCCLKLKSLSDDNLTIPDKPQKLLNQRLENKLKF